MLSLSFLWVVGASLSLRRGGSRDEPTFSWGLASSWDCQRPPSCVWGSWLASPALRRCGIWDRMLFLNVPGANSHWAPGSQP